MNLSALWGRRAFSMTDLIVILAVLAVIAVAVALVLPALLTAKECSNWVKCPNNLEQVGCAIAAYYGQYNDYYPFIDSKYATDSLTLIYPDFSANVRIFDCPSALQREGRSRGPAVKSTEKFSYGDGPEISVNFVERSEQSGWIRTHTWFGDETGRALKAPKWSSYGYDDRVHHAHAGANHVVAGDMDASFATGKGETSNHPDGGNFLRFDGHVSFETTVYCSNNPLDNIFAVQSVLDRNNSKTWCAETDSWLRRP